MDNSGWPAAATTASCRALSGFFMPTNPQAAGTTPPHRTTPTQKVRASAPRAAPETSPKARDSTRAAAPPATVSCAAKARAGDSSFSAAHRTYHSAVPVAAAVPR